MQTYFSAIQPHLEDHVDIAIIKTTQSSNSKAIASLGIDNLIYLKDLSSQSENRIYLPENSKYQCIASSINPDKCIFGSQNGTVEEFNLQNQQTNLLYKSEYKINSLCNSPTNKYIAIASQQSKCILVDINTLRASKCRPGHQSGVANTCFSEDQKYIASIGMDKTLFIYSIQNFDQPVEKFHIKICKSQTTNSSVLYGCFHKLLQIFYAPGMKQMQIVQLLNNKWEYRLSKFIKHINEVIQLVKIIKTSLLVTCSVNEFFIWNNKSQQKIIVLQDFTLNKIIQINDTFWGCKNDGRIFCYKKVLNDNLGGDANQQKTQKMQIENNNNNDENNDDVMVFDDQAEQDQSEKQKSVISQKHYELQKQKKSKADRLITAYPQQPVTTKTSQYDSACYLRTSHNGYLIYKNQVEFQKRIQFQSEQKPASQLLFLNKQIKYTDFNGALVAYANQNQYGVKFLKHTYQSYFADYDSWEKHWEDIAAIACSYQWVAVANDQQIKVLDVTGNELKNISFDRIIVAMAAYQNLLAVAYHQTIPIDGSQCLSMQLYVVNNQKNEVLKCSSCHVPLKPKSLLKFFQFSNEGMLIAQDDSGFIRIYNLENNTWTSVIVEGAQDTRRIWLLGMKDYKLIYWKTSQLNPDPKVFPRLPIKTSRLGTNVTTQDPERMSQYPYLMFQRFCLDHEKCRSRLWLNLKSTRTSNYPGYKNNISTILSIKEIAKHHNQLDYKFFEFIQFYLGNPKTYQKALMAVKTLIRTIEAGKMFINIFDEVKLRSLAIELQIYFEEKQKQIQFEAIQNFQLNELKQEAERTIKPKGQNNPFNKKKNTDYSSIPSLNMSQMSQGSNFDSLSERSIIKASKQNGMKMANTPAILETPQKQQISNPFLKKKSTDEDGNFKARQIEQQIQKFGIKKKVQILKRPNNNKM